MTRSGGANNLGLIFSFPMVATTSPRIVPNTNTITTVPGVLPVADGNVSPSVTLIHVMDMNTASVGDTVGGGNVQGTSSSGNTGYNTVTAMTNGHGNDNMYGVSYSGGWWQKGVVWASE